MDVDSLDTQEDAAPFLGFVKKVVKKVKKVVGKVKKVVKKVKKVVDVVNGIRRVIGRGKK